MYFFIVIATTVVLPIGSAVIDYLMHGSRGDQSALRVTIAYLGTWYVFWAGGVRLMLAGLRQTFAPGFTLKQIFEIDHKPSEHIVQELGFANISIGLMCILTMIWPFVLAFGPAVAAGLFYGLAGLQHIRKPGRNAQRTLAMVTDLLVFAVLAAYVALFTMSLF